MRRMTIKLKKWWLTSVILDGSNAEIQFPQWGLIKYIFLSSSSHSRRLCLAGCSRIISVGLKLAKVQLTISRFQSDFLPSFSSTQLNIRVHLWRLHTSFRSNIFINLIFLSDVWKFRCKAASSLDTTAADMHRQHSAVFAFLSLSEFLALNYVIAYGLRQLLANWAQGPLQRASNSSPLKTREEGGLALWPYFPRKQYIFLRGWSHYMNSVFYLHLHKSFVHWLFYLT